MPPPQDDRSPGSGPLPAGISISKRAEKKRRAAEHQQQQRMREREREAARVEYNFRGHAQNQTQPQPQLQLQNQQQLGTHAVTPKPKNTVLIPSAPSVHEQGRPRAQSPPREPRGRRANEIPPPLSSRLYDSYVPDRDHNPHRPRLEEVGEPYRDRSPLQSPALPVLKPTDYDLYLQRHPQSAEGRDRSLDGDREKTGDWHRGSPRSPPRGPIQRGRPRSRSPNSPAPASGTSSTNSSRRTNSNLYKSIQQRAESAERRAVEAAAYMHVHPSRQSLVPRAPKSTDSHAQSPIAQSANPGSNQSADSPRSPVHLTVPAAVDVPMADRLPPSQPGRQPNSTDNATYLLLDEVTNIASLKNQKSTTEINYGRHDGEYGKGKDKVHSKYPALGESSIKSRDSAVEAIRSLKVNITKRDNSMKEIGSKIPGFLSGSSPSVSQTRVDELEKICNGFENKLLQMQQKFMDEQQKLLQQSMQEHSNLRKQNNDQCASLKADIGQLRTSHLGLKGDHETLHKKVEQAIPANLEQSLTKFKLDLAKLTPLLVRMDSNDNARRESNKDLKDFTTRVEKLENDRLAYAANSTKTQAALDLLDDRLKEAKAQIIKSTPLIPQSPQISPLPQLLETRLAAIESQARNVSAFPTSLDTRISTLESQPRLDSFRIDIMKDVDILQNSTIKEVGSTLQSIANAGSKSKERIDELEKFSSSAKTDISEAKSRIKMLEVSPSSAAGIGAIELTVKATQGDVIQLQHDLKDAKRAIPAVAVTHVLDTLRTQPQILPYAPQTSQLAECPRRLEELSTKADQASLRFNEVLTRIDDVDFKADHLDQRMNNINTKEQAQFIVSQIAEQYPSLRHAIDTVILKTEVETLSKRISATEDAQNNNNSTDTSSLVTAVLRRDHDELSRKVADLKRASIDQKKDSDSLAGKFSLLEQTSCDYKKNSDDLAENVVELEKLIREEKQELIQSISDTAIEFSRVQVEIEAVGATSSKSKQDMQNAIDELKADHERSGADIKSRNDQKRSQIEMKAMKESLQRLDNEIDAIRSNQKRSEKDLEAIKSTQTTRNSIFPSRYDPPPPTPKTGVVQGLAARQLSAQGESSGKKRSKAGSIGSIGPMGPKQNGGPKTRKKRKIGDPDDSDDPDFELKKSGPITINDSDSDSN